MAVDWLTDRHRKGFKVAVESLFDDLWPEDAPSDISSLDAEVLESVQIDLVEWLIAEGDMLVKGERRRINEVLTGPDGPRLSDGQRRWLAQQGERLLCGYTVTEVRRGDGLYLCDATDATDATDADAPAVVVQERTASRQLRTGSMIGARVVQVGDHLEPSGAIYPFSMLAKPGVLAVWRAAGDANSHPDNVAVLRSRALARAWVRQFVLPPALPQMIDAPDRAAHAAGDRPLPRAGRRCAGNCAGSVRRRGGRCAGRLAS